VNPRIAPMRRMDTPHPLVTVLGLLVITGLLVVGFQTDFQSPVLSATGVFVAVLFTAVCRSSARQMRRRRGLALEAMRRQPVLHLND